LVMEELVILLTYLKILDLSLLGSINLTFYLHFIQHSFIDLKYKELQALVREEGK